MEWFIMLVPSAIAIIVMGYAYKNNFKKEIFIVAFCLDMVFNMFALKNLPLYLYLNSMIVPLVIFYLAIYVFREYLQKD